MLGGRSRPLLSRGARCHRCCSALQTRIRNSGHSMVPGCARMKNPVHYCISCMYCTAPSANNLDTLEAPLFPQSPCRPCRQDSAMTRSNSVRKRWERTVPYPSSANLGASPSSRTRKNGTCLGLVSTWNPSGSCEERRKVNWGGQNASTPSVFILF